MSFLDRFGNPYDPWVKQTHQGSGSLYMNIGGSEKLFEEVEEEGEAPRIRQKTRTKRNATYHSTSWGGTYKHFGLTERQKRILQRQMREFHS